MKLTITSDGTTGGTRIIDEHGRELRGVQSIEWSINDRRGRLPRHLVSDVPVALTADAEVRHG